MKLPEELSKLSNVMEKLQNQVNLETWYIFWNILMITTFFLQSDIISNVDFWVQSFESYYTNNFESPPSIFNLTELEFRQRLTQYLFSKEGSRHRLMFRYHEELIKSTDTWSAVCSRPHLAPLKEPCCVGCSNFLMPRCNGCSADDDYDDFGHFIFKAHFENFLEFLDSRTQGVN